MAGETAGMIDPVSFESMAPAGAIDSNAKANYLKLSFFGPRPIAGQTNSFFAEKNCFRRTKIFFGEKCFFRKKNLAFESMAPAGAIDSNETDLNIPADSGPFLIICLSI